MYKILRNTHLFLGLFLCLFILTYGVSGVEIAHRSWFSITSVTTEKEIAVPEAAKSPRALARELMEHHGIRGVLSEVRKTDEGFGFEINRTGTGSEVNYNAATGRAKIRTDARDFLGMLLAIHFTTAGFPEGYWLQSVWGAFVVLVSGALIILGCTGIYMWFKIHAERVIGTFLLIIGLGWGATLTVLLFIT